MRLLTLNVHTACLAAICSHSFYTGVRLALAVLTLRLTGAPAAVGVVMMSYALLPALLSPRIGRAADRHGVQRLLPLCLWLMVFCGLALWGLALNTALLVVAAALVGLGFNTFAVSIQKLIGSLPPAADRPDESAADRRKRNFGALATASSVSSFAGPLLAGWGLDHLPAGAVFGLLAVLPLLAWLISRAWALPGVAAGGGSAAVAGAAAPPASAGAAGAAQPPAARSPLLAPALWPLAVAIVMLTVAGDALAFLTPIIGGQQGLSATAVGGIVSAFAVGAFVVRLCSGFFIARVREQHYLSLTLPACAVWLLLYGQAASVLALAALSFVLGAWLGLAQPMTQSLLHRSVPEHRVGEALGTRLALVGAAQAASPLLLGLGVQRLDIASTLAVVSGLLVLAGVYVARAGRRDAADD